MSTINRPVKMPVVRAEQEVRTALRQARENTRVPQRDMYCRNLALDILSRDVPKSFGVRQMLTLLHDAFERGASEADLLAVPDALSRALRSWYTHSERPDFGKEWGEETSSEWKKNVKEIEFDQNPSHVTLLELEEAHREYSCESEDFLRAARARVTPPVNVA